MKKVGWPVVLVSFLSGVDVLTVCAYWVGIQEAESQPAPMASFLQPGLGLSLSIPLGTFLAIA